MPKARGAGVSFFGYFLDKQKGTKILDGKETSSSRKEVNHSLQEERNYFLLSNVDSRLRGNDMKGTG